VIGTRVRVTYTDPKNQPEELTITHYAFGRVARWARTNGMPGFSIEEAQGMAEQVLALQLACWAEKTRGMDPAPGFDAWVAKVADFDPVGEDTPDPTEAARGAA
jgi:hypothetical protein